MTYRDDDEALRARSAVLRDELEEVDRRAAVLEFLACRRAAIETELADVERRRSRPVALPLLARARIASPCSADWSTMLGDDRVRHCFDCGKNVYDLGRMTAEAAEALLREHEGAACVRIARRADGSIITSDCPVGARRRLRTGTAGVLAAGLIASAMTAYAFRPAPPLLGTDDRETYGRVLPAPHTRTPRSEVGSTMGRVAVPMTWAERAVVHPGDDTKLAIDLTIALRQ